MFYWKHRLSWVGLLICSGWSALCQLPDYHVRLFDETYGMRNDMEKVIMDNKDFIWLASYDQIFRFDGKTTLEFAEQEHVVSILCDARGDIWTNSESRVRRFKNDREGFIPVTFDTSGDLRLGPLFLLPGREICLFTSLGVFEWNPEEKKFNRWDATDFPGHSKLNAGYFTQYGSTLFFSSQDTLFAMDTRDKSVLAFPWDKEQGRIHAISDHEVLMTLRGNQSIWMDYASQTFTEVNIGVTTSNGMEDFFYVRDVLPIDEDRILIASHSGLLELNKPKREFREVILYNKGLPLTPSPFFYDLFRDRNQKTWLLHLRGLVSFSMEEETIGMIRSMNTNGQNVWQNNVRNFAEDSEGSIWLSTSLGFGRWNLKSNTIKMYLPKAGAMDQLGQPSVRGLWYDGQYLLLGTSSGGVWMFDPGKEKYRRPEYGPGEEGKKLKASFEKEFIKQIAPLPGGNIFIVARKGFIVDKNTYAIKEFPIDRWTSSQPTLVYTGRDNNVWIGTEDGILCFDQNLNFLHYWKLNLSVSTLHEFQSDDWLIGTPSGLYELAFQGDSFHLQRNTELPEQIWTSFIVTDARGDFWIGSKEGLCRYKPRSKQVDYFDYTDNTLGNNYAPFPYFGKDGTLYIGGPNGLNYFHPEKIKSPRDSLQVTLTKVIVNQDDSTYFNRAKLMDLGSQQNNIEIQFIAPYYRNADRVQYRYQLEGLTPGWINSGTSNLIRFSALPPGHYTFRIAASSNGFHWFEGKEVLTFTIAAPVWQRWWFITLAFIVVLGLVYLYLLRRIETAREKEQTKRQYEKRIAEVEMHALRAQMNPHFMFNSLNSINNFILKNDPDNASGYLTKFSRLMRLILDNSRSEWILLVSELKALELYIQLEVVRFDEVFEYELIVDSSVDPDTTYVPPMIIQPYVENAIWHGLLHRHKPGGKLMIRIWRENEILHINVEDNGVGRTEAARLKSKSATRHKSHGLRITAERMEIVNRIYNVNAKVDIFDVHGQNGTPGGTRVSLTLQDKMYDGLHRG